MLRCHFIPVAKDCLLFFHVSSPLFSEYLALACLTMFARLLDLDIV